MEEEEEASKPALPDAFLDFLKENGLDPSIYSESHSTPRYIRLKPGLEARIEEIEAEIKWKLEEVEWLPGFYALPPDVQIANSNAYREGKIYGIDAASGAAVSALDISAGDHVLDLCAAPGAKLCMISDLLGDSGSVTGVDVSSHRLAACRTMLQKYALGNRCRLFVADGTNFSLIPRRVHSDPKSCESALEENLTFKEWTSRRPWKERKQAARIRKSDAVRSGNQLPDLIYYGCHSGVVGLTKSELYQTFRDDEYLSYGYDKVLVDAECTHDGSIKHVQKFEQWGWETLQRRVLDAERSDSLTVLQLKLLTNGFRLLKAGGILVYSTCSLTVAQNEDVVKQFLEGHPCAELQVIDAAENWPCKNGRVPNTLRFDPLTSKTSGLFVAKFSKLTI
ncbi:rRNA (cytosine-C(5))-methyltransferase NOP2C-like isoform X1 [Pyrus communis]|uniref:rRNA (cytosine-C(5))-methyltransferase NOP2C-like isoform X1 n=1 Tax=Pyrus communis TaxID=23211 RepID=UPI0035C090B9